MRQITSPHEGENCSVSRGLAVELAAPGHGEFLQRWGKAHGSVAAERFVGFLSIFQPVLWRVFLVTANGSVGDQD